MIYSVAKIITYSRGKSSILAKKLKDGFRRPILVNPMLVIGIIVGLFI